MERRDRFHLGLQYLLGRLAVVITVPFVFLALRIRGYRIRDLERVRSEVDRLFGEHEGPWLICPNHLTMIDSILISYGMASFCGHIGRYRNVPWNLPERDNFQKNPFLAMLCYLGKCLPVNRGGSREELQRLFDKCRYVLGWRQRLLIFPEGGRSRTGRVDRENFSYGVGRFLDECPGCKVMLVYLRGDHQESFGMMPRAGERLTMKVELFDPGDVPGAGLRLQREYARRIVERLAVMEEEYFASRG
ncbi:MAG: 1-acyl-sn-glycerol-3-phosphate acyltransferase [Deltaproteobacteria bacterium]|nr:1-acyl-sn-glycerol-3-phosphate acyltransferase [Deltaproteobacteria bacterium]